ncbi:MAG: glycine cleavage system aminomethyltransferase GcvT [Candidatus Omnitrophota bacterium]|nr:glycine cleavage system aminomethyltransferase GcvT [Candidatus Omnitrophota bacterium]
MLKTPLYDTHLALGAKIAPFGGWLMPIQYQGILAEHAHTRNAVCVFDICHMGEFMSEGDPTLSGLDRIVTQNIISMPQGSCRYGFMLNEQGGVLDDLVVYRINKNNWMLVVNAATTPGDYEHLKKNLLGQYVLRNVSNETAKLDVQGPQSLDVLKNIFGQGLLKLKYYTFSEFVFQNQNCIVSRTGYTGELGFEIYISTDYVIKLWEVLLRDVRVKPAGLGCRDTLRLEMGYPLYGQDLDINHTPLSSGFGKFVDLSKDFIGKDALLKEQKSGSGEHLICFQADSRRAPRHGFAIFAGDKRVGTVTSGSFSPSLSVGIGIGYVCGNYDIGTGLIIKEAGIEIPVKVVKKPFYRCSSK